MSHRDGRGHDQSSACFPSSCSEKRLADFRNSGVLSLIDRAPGPSGNSCVLFRLAIGGQRETGSCSMSLALSRRDCLAQFLS